MKLYRRLKKVRSVEICDPHFMPMEFTTGWVEDDKMSDEDLIKHAHEQHGDNFQYILEEKFIPYEQDPKAEKVIKMRRPTPEERESIEKYVKSISKTTGIDFWKLEQETCDDAISRQAVNVLVDELARAISDERCCMSRGRSTASIMQDILDLPSVKPQEPKESEG